MRKNLTVLSVFVVLLASGPAFGELFNKDLVCRAPTTDLTVHEYLKALSFDLRGTPPSMEEYTAVDGLETVPENLIDEWLNSEAFVNQAIAFHQSLLWNNLSNIDFFHRNTTFNTGPGKVYYRRYQGTYYRGDRVPCLDEPVSYTESGDIKMTAVTNDEGEVTYREGWVKVVPYWAPDSEIKVCALDAQDVLVGKSGKACNTTAAFKDTSCGCGPNLLWCSYQGNGPLYKAVQRDMELRIKHVVANDLPYTDLLLDTPMFVNGPLVHFLKHQSQFARNVKILPLAIPVAQLPDLNYTQADTWVPLKLGQQHSGILTSPAFLWRYQTNRSRANKYYNTFLCQPFQPPPGGLIGSSDEEAKLTDLQKRPGCKYCHAELEPASSYWGRWPELGAGFLADNKYPAFSQDCADCAVKNNCKNFCKNNYITKALHPSEAEYFGWLKPYLFRKSAHQKFVEQGPSLLVMNTMVDHRLPSCTTENLSRWLLGRVALTEEKSWFADFAQQFVSSNYSFKQLVKAVVTSPIYRRVK